MGYDRREINQQWYHRFDEKAMKIIVLQHNEEGEEIEKSFPAKYKVCGTCDGKGKHVNPSIDSHGLSREDFDNDPDFAEDYFSGCYDVPCNECHGNRVTPEIDMDSLSPEDKKFVENEISDHFSYQRELARERQMGY